MYRHLLKFAFLFLSVSIVKAGNNPGPFTMPQGLTTNDYQAKTIILRVKENYRQACQAQGIEIRSLQSILNGINGQVHKIFPNHLPPAQPKNEYGFAYADLSLIYELKYGSDADLIKVINSIINTGVVEYAEPRYIPHVEYIPNDPQMTANQQFLQRINAEAGWDVSQGDTNTLIGITDTGTDWDHPDLAPNLQLNYADPINGADDDGDGFVDNYRGWDIGENDNNPMVGNCGICSHGSHVSGCAAATTDNNIGVASPGFKCRFLPVKIANASGSLTKAYEGIAYAADHGCHIINCSWGGGGGGSFGQNIIDYATINKNSLVIAAAGNNSSNQLFYPAAYNYVLCVAATNSSNDNKASFSNYGSFVDVCAPGNNIYSTVVDDSYTSMSGTSMAAPVCAGVAAIVRSYFPSYNALQVGEQVRTTTDNIYSLPQNSIYLNQLGTGRINLLNALVLSGPSIRMSPINTSDHGDEVFLAGDSLFITGDIINYLAATTNLDITLSTTSTYVTIIDNLTNVGVLGTMATTNNNPDPFIVKINTNAPQNAVITFMLTFTDGAYTDIQMFNVIVNVDYINITVNDVWTTNSSKGRLCYNGEAQAEGLGFDFNGLGTLAYETGFMAGVSSVVNDNVRGIGAGADSDWEPVTVIQKTDPGVFSDFDTYGDFSDASSPAPLGLLVNHRSFSWSAPPNARFHIFEYKMHNAGVSSINNLYAGIFSDWDVMDYNNNKAGEDAAARLGYVWSTDSAGLYAGIRLLTPGAFNHYAVDNITGGSGGVDLTNGYDDGEKYTTLSTARAMAGGAGTGNDVIDVVGTGPFSISPGDSVTVAFALIAGYELSDLINSANQAQIMYDIATGVEEIGTSEVSMMIYPNPAKESVNIYYNLKKSGSVQIKLSDLSGRSLYLSETSQAAGDHLLKLNTSVYASGLYFIEISNGESRSAKKILISGN